jgi:putative transposase
MGYQQHDKCTVVQNVLEEAIAIHGKPEIINSDQGSQYTSALWTQYLEQQGINISMDGKGRALDKISIERFWKSLKNDYIYLNPVDDGFELYGGVQNHHRLIPSKSPSYH